MTNKKKKALKIADIEREDLLRLEDAFAFAKKNAGVMFGKSHTDVDSCVVTGSSDRCA